MPKEAAEVPPQQGQPEQGKEKKFEPFYAETVDYMEKMKAAGVPVEYRVYKGCYHGFDVICPESEPGKDAIQFLHDSLIYAAENYTAKQPE